MLKAISRGGGHTRQLGRVVKALALGASGKPREFDPPSCHIFYYFYFSEIIFLIIFSKNAIFCIF